MKLKRKISTNVPREKRKRRQQNWKVLFKVCWKTLRNFRCNNSWGHCKKGLGGLEGLVGLRRNLSSARRTGFPRLCHQQ